MISLLGTVYSLFIALQGVNMREESKQAKLEVHLNELA